MSQPDSTTSQRPLDGIRAVDFSTNLVGAHIGQFLADFGAEVVMVEPPEGNPLRSQPAWPFWARGKLSTVLDLHEEADLATAQDLAKAADVVVQTWRPGVAERLGLSFGDLRSTNPGVVLASVTGFGRTGPLKDIKGYEGVVMAKIGAFDAFGGITPRNGPAYTSAPFGAFSAAQTTLQGILAALFERGQSGVGQQVDTSLAQSVAAHDTWGWLIASLVRKYAEAFSGARPFDHEAMVPNSPLFFRLMVGLSQDGRWMQLSQTTDKLWEAFVRLAGLDVEVGSNGDPALDEDPQVRVQFWEKVLGILRDKTYDEWLEGFDREPDVWAETFRSGSELLDHPQMLHDQQVISPEVEGLGPVRQPAPTVKLASNPGSGDGHVPALGEHADAVQALLQAAQTHADGVRDAGSEAPLAGITVVEFGTFYAGPYGATLLTDLGARVIKIESLEGDPIRHIMPFPEVGGVKVLQGKESVAVDITSSEGKEIAYELVRRADLVLCAFRAGVAERLGFDYESLKAVNPGVVYLSSPGYGTSGPMGHRPAFAPTIAAGSGLAMRNIGPSLPEDPTTLSTEELKPLTVRLSASAMGYAHADGFSALGVGTALLLGLVARERLGVGLEMTTTMLSTMAHALSEDMVQYANRKPLAAADPELHGLSARYRLYEAADDSWVFLAAPQEREWDDLVRALSRWADLAGDQRFATAKSRRSNDEALSAVLGAVFRTRPADEWETDLLAEDVACVAVAPGPIESHVTEMEGLGGAHDYLVDQEHPVLGEYVRLKPLWRFSRSGGVTGAAPMCGQDTDTVLGELGYDLEAIAVLKETGVAGD